MLPQTYIPTSDAEPAEPPSRTYRIDWRAGRIVGMADGLDAIRQAAVKILMTERYACPIYTPQYGAELGQLAGQPPGYAVARLPSVIEEALTADRRITGVTGLTITSPDPRTIACAFTVQAAAGQFAQEVTVDA